MPVDPVRQSLTLYRGQDAVVPFDCPAGVAVPAAVEFTAADDLEGTPFGGFPIAGTLDPSPPAGTVRWLVTIPRAVTATLPVGGAPVWSLWDVDGTYEPLAVGTLLVARTARKV